MYLAVVTVSSQLKVLNMHKNIQRDATTLSWFYQDLYMFRVPAILIIRSTIVQLAVTGITYSNKIFVQKVYCVKNTNKQGVLARCNIKD
jgi:hypothetical protein